MRERRTRCRTTVQVESDGISIDDNSMSDSAQSEAEKEMQVEDEAMGVRPIMALSSAEAGKPHRAMERRLKMRRGITVDSGAADPVMPKRMVRGKGNTIRPSEASKAGVHYITASATRIPNEGETDLKFSTEEGHSLNWTFQIAEVNKVLASVSWLVDHGHRVVFDKDVGTGRDISFITHKGSGQAIKMKRDRNVWVIDAFVTESSEPVFARPERAP